ncbi:MAG TPA: hypothetical protein VKX17_07165 [Planctomycetota bacterium]|nr:hypothetical protein [Planctomycetota bacterium]
MLSQSSEVGAAVIVEEMEQTEHAQFHCEICGKNQSKRGVPFNATTLRMHKIKHDGVSPGRLEAGAPTNGAHSSLGLASLDHAPLRCDICGATGGKRGGQFRSVRDLLTHKAHAHREAPGRLEAGAATLGAQETRPTASHVRFCPHCGCNLAVVNAALAFLDGDQS